MTRLLQFLSPATPDIDPDEATARRDEARVRRVELVKRRTIARVLADALYAERQRNHFGPTIKSALASGEDSHDL